MTRGTVLLVEENDESLDRMGRWLVEDGFWVLTCPGPLAPLYTCPAARGEICPLVELANVIVLDTWLQTDTMMEGLPGWQLLLYYLSIGKPVVALTAPGDPVELASGDRNVLFLRRLPGRRELISAVHSLLGTGEPARLPGRAPTIPFRPEKEVRAVVDVRDEPSPVERSEKGVADVADIWSERTVVEEELVLDAHRIDAIARSPLTGNVGVTFKTLWENRGDGSYAGLMYVAAGASVRPHAHRYSEHHVWIADGECEVRGKRLGRGAYMHVPAGITHSIDASGAAGCKIFYLYQCTT